MNNFLNRQAFFADGTPFYRLYTADGAEAAGCSVRLRFRTAEDNAASVMVVTDCVRAKMHKSFSERNFDYYETYFIIRSAGRIIILKLPESERVKKG